MNVNFLLIISKYFRRTKYKNQIPENLRSKMSFFCIFKKKKILLGSPESY
jgi:hypothetical protein